MRNHCAYIISSLPSNHSHAPSNRTRFWRHCTTSSPFAHLTHQTIVRYRSLTSTCPLARCLVFKSINRYTRAESPGAEEPWNVGVPSGRSVNNGNHAEGTLHFAEKKWGFPPKCPEMVQPKVRTRTRRGQQRTTTSHPIVLVGDNREPRHPIPS